MPKIGFQHLDIVEHKHKKIGDPGGFCALWSIWYCDMRITYPSIPRDKLIKKIIKTVKAKNISFKNLIRNYSINIINLRDSLFKGLNITINDWINDQYTEKQLIDIITKITDIISGLY